MSIQTIQKSIPKALYHPILDERRDIYELDSSADMNQGFVSKVKSQARSVACLMRVEYLQDDSGTAFSISAAPSLEKQIGRMGAPYEAEGPYRNQPVAGIGTAFLVGKRFVVTAGHCVCGYGSSVNIQQINSLRVVFDFAMENKTTHQPIYKKNVYVIQNVVAFSRTSTGDWALLNLDREVTDRVPFEIDDSNQIEPGEKTYMIGHPNGIPLKLAYNGIIKSQEKTRPCVLLPHVRIELFIAAFSGNSGSPICKEQTNRVVGILTNGCTDYGYVWTKDAICRSRYSRDTVNGEIGQRISFVSKVITEANQAYLTNPVLFLSKLKPLVVEIIDKPIAKPNYNLPEIESEDHQFAYDEDIANRVNLRDWTGSVTWGAGIAIGAVIASSAAPAVLPILALQAGSTLGIRCLYNVLDNRVEERRKEIQSEDQDLSPLNAREQAEDDVYHNSNNFVRSVLTLPLTLYNKLGL